MPHYAAFHLGLHCLPKYPFKGFRSSKGKIGVNVACIEHRATEGPNLFSKSPLFINKIVMYKINIYIFIMDYAN